jgi:uncharacterized damage-inducible protein DinB
MESAKEVLLLMNDYNRQVNADMIKHLEAANPMNERIALLMSHIINAHQIWLERMQGNRMSVKVFELRPYQQLMLQVELNHSVTKDIIDARNLDENITYINTKRQKFKNSMAEMFLHLFNHSSYHRGQINQLLVQEGKEAMVSDFIVYNRTEIFE